MKVIAFPPNNWRTSIENENVVNKILKHFGLWDIKRKPPPRAKAPPIDVFPAYDQPTAPTVDYYLTDPACQVGLSGRSSQSEA